MKKIGILVLLFPWLVMQAQTSTKQYVRSLKESTATGVMFGHHDDTLYGYRRRRGDGTGSDTQDVVGMFPAMMSFDISLIENAQKNRAIFDQMRTAIQEQHARGGFSTISWHADNIVTRGNSWDVSGGRVVSRILPGGDKAEDFLVWLNNVADFFLSLTDKDGEPIPIIFRPWHECNGTWFWWGRDLCTVDEYKALWSLTVKSLKKRGVKNVIYAFSPGGDIKSEKEYLSRYPGDKIISVLGVEGYAIRTTGSATDRQKFILNTRRSFDVVTPIAQKKKKLLAFTETGMKHNTDTQWWTQTLMPAIEGYPLCFLVTWRNATNDDNECYGIYKGHPAEADFKRFAQNPKILFR
jgi:mannan endo-1,4-beta-mannosidase